MVATVDLVGKNLQPSWETHTLVVKPVYDMYIDIHISNSCSTHPASTRQRSPGFECHTMVSNSGCRVSGLRSWSYRKSAEHEGTRRHIPTIGVIGRVYLNHAGIYVYVYIWIYVLCVYVNIFTYTYKYIYTQMHLQESWFCQKTARWLWVQWVNSKIHISGC